MSRPLHVLVIDDSPADLELTQLAFEGLDDGIQVRTCAGGTAALELLTGAPGLPDVVLLDVNMPGLSGFEVLERVRGIPALSHLPVVMLTTSTNPADLARAQALGASDYVTKPASFLEFEEQAAQLAQRWRAMSQAQERAPHWATPA